MKIFLLILLSIGLNADKPKLFLFNNYGKNKDVSDWYISKKQ